MKALFLALAIALLSPSNARATAVDISRGFDCSVKMTTTLGVEVLLSINVAPASKRNQWVGIASKTDGRVYETSAPFAMQAKQSANFLEFSSSPGEKIFLENDTIKLVIKPKEENGVYLAYGFSSYFGRRSYNMVCRKGV